MRYRFIILSVFWAVLCCGPVLGDEAQDVAANTNAAASTESSDEQTANMPAVTEENKVANADPEEEQGGIEETIEEDEEFEQITIDVDSVGWCADKEYVEDDEEITLDQEDERQVKITINRGSDDPRRKQLCDMLNSSASTEQSTNDQLRQNTQELQENYDNLKANEQSLANRTLTAASIAATGIGGMELAMGLSQQKADKAADADMEAYISTFQCKVGDTRYKGGQGNIELPGANQLTKLYQEYAALATSLKERKEALGMKPGLESQVVLDKANMGLYNDVGHGIEKGTQASRYRASKGSEEDAKKLQDEKDAAKKRVIAGGVAAGAGVVGGIVGNMIINKDVKNRTTELRRKRSEIKSTFNSLVKTLLDECNATIQGHKDWVKQHPDLADKMPEYKQDVENAQPVTTIQEIRSSLFCK